MVKVDTTEIARKRKNNDKSRSNNLNRCRANSYAQSFLTTLLVVLLISTTSSFSQSFAPSSARKGAHVGIGMHGGISISQNNTSYAGMSAQFGYVWEKFGVSLAPEFNGFQFENKSEEINSGYDFGASLIGLYRPKSDVSIGGGVNLQATEKTGMTNQWTANKDISILGGVGKNWIVGPLNLSLSGMMKFNPSAEDLTLAADLSLHYSFR